MQAQEDHMVTDDAAQTQQETQSTQEASQHEFPPDDHLWGYLIPCSAQQRRIDFSKDKKSYKVGRNRESSVGNDHILLGMKISMCSAFWLALFSVASSFCARVRLIVRLWVATNDCASDR